MIWGGGLWGTQGAGPAEKGAPRKSGRRLWGPGPTWTEGIPRTQSPLQNWFRGSGGTVVGDFSRLCGTLRFQRPQTRLYKREEEVLTILKHVSLAAQVFGNWVL